MGRGAISLVRISGPDLTFLSQKLKLKNLVNKKAIVKEIQLNDSFKEKCVLTFFKSPNSFTGEDVLEISCHGNPLIVELIIDFFVDLGCRRAGPGEFSLRAFINGKLSYLEAEAIDDLINSENELQLNASARSLDGEFEKKIDDSLLISYKKIRSSVKNGLAIVPVERGASAGSFFVIPPQVQLDIASRKKFITDEYSGRILVDKDLAEDEEKKMEKIFNSI